jgi:GT2 family glycosyltransferase
MSLTAIVILNYNGDKLLRQFLPAVIQNSIGADIVVADNASSDESISILKSEFPAIRIIQLDKNFGYAGGYNRALMQVEADYFVLLNSDVEVTPGWLDPLTRLLDEDTTIAAVQPKILSFRDRRMFEHAGAAGGFIDGLGYPFCRGRIFDTLEKDEGQYDDDRDIFWASGACFIVRASVFRAVGGFDEDFFAHMEEIDFCWKVHRTQQRVHYTSRSVVYHVGAGTLQYGNPGKIYLNFRNGLTMLFKHLLWYELMLKFPVRIALDWIAVLRFVATGDVGSARAIIRAHIAFVTAFGDALKKRRIVQQMPAYDTTAIKRGSIVFEYFILKKKIFTGLV